MGGNGPLTLRHQRASRFSSSKKIAPDLAVVPSIIKSRTIFSVDSWWPGARPCILRISPERIYATQVPQREVTLSGGGAKWIPRGEDTHLRSARLCGEDALAAPRRLRGLGLLFVAPECGVVLDFLNVRVYFADHAIHLDDADVPFHVRHCIGPFAVPTGRRESSPTCLF